MPRPYHRDAPGTMSALHRIPGLLDDAAMLLLIVFSIPLIVLVIGTPVALVARLLLEIARRL
jgi:hypothetical protein